LEGDAGLLDPAAGSADAFATGAAGAGALVGATAAGGGCEATSPLLPREAARPARRAAASGLRVCTIGAAFAPGGWV